MKKFVDKLDKKFNLGISYESWSHGNAANAQQQKQQQQQQQQQLQQPLQTTGPPPGQHYTPPPPGQHYAPPPPGQHYMPPPSGQLDFPPPPTQTQQFIPPPPPQTQQFTPPPPPPQTQVASVTATAVFMGPPTLQEVNRYRTHHGTNIGAVFALERWLFPSMFLESAKGGSELSAVTAFVDTHGLDAARAKWEQHWATAVTPADWMFLRETGKVTSIRLPIGWFTLGPQFCAGTPFEPYGSIYVNAWTAVKGYIHAAAERGIAVLLDLHALPGGANKDEHSGTDSGKSEFWENQTYRVLTTEVLVTIAREITADPTLKDWVLGLQVVNEAIIGAGDRGMWSWYDHTLAAIASVDPRLPVYISDAWNSGSALDYAATKNSASRTNLSISPPVIVDIHKYYCFDPADKNKSPPEIISAATNELSELFTYDEKEVGTVVGEYSCVLAEESWSKADPAARPDLIRQLGQTEIRRWEKELKPINGGSFFWTGKMQWMDGGEWGFVEQAKKGNIPPSLGFTLPAQRVEEISTEAKQHQVALRATAIKQHVEYWNQHGQGHQMEHWRYEAGHNVGFWDAVTFWEKRAEKGRDGGDTIGFVNMWAGKRLRDHVAERGTWESTWLWEFEHGVKRGIADFESLIK